MLEYIILEGCSAAAKSRSCRTLVGATGPGTTGICAGNGVGYRDAGAD